MVKKNTQLQFYGLKHKKKKGTHAKAYYFFLLKLCMHSDI